MQKTFHTNTQALRKRARSIGFAVALVCLFAGSAHANPHELPKTFTTIPATPTDVAGDHDGEDLLLAARRANALSAPKPIYRRYSKLKVVNYSRNIEVGREELTVKVQSPGRRKSIMMLEVKF